MQNCSLITMSRWICKTYWIVESAVQQTSIWHVGLLTSDSNCSGPHLEFARFSHIFDTFKWLVRLSVHVETAHFKTCTEEESSVI